MSPRVAVGGIHTECSTYNPLQQTAGDFARTEGDALLAEVPWPGGLHLAPIFHDRSVPGGPVAREVWDRQCAEFLSRLDAAMPLDGALLLMHGAMAVPGVPDPEGDLICAVRARLGPSSIIAASYDLHGHMSARIASALDILCAYRTAPHVDVAQTHARAARHLARALAGGPRPQVAMRHVPLLVPGEMSSTRIEPCRSLYGALPGHDARPGIWDANLLVGYVWADVERAGAAAVVTCTDPAAGARSAREIAEAYWAARHALRFEMQALPLAAAVSACQGPSVLADSGDNPTAGGVGDRADALGAVLSAGRSALVAGIADPPAVAALRTGARRIATGGALGGGGPRLDLAIDDCRFAKGCAIVRTGPATVILTEARRPFHHLGDLADLGIRLASHPLLVVKMGYLVPEIAALPRRHVMALTAGAVSQDLGALENRSRPQRSLPFENAR